MSEAIAFDTHRYVKRPTENGFTEKQAETLADEQVAFLKLLCRPCPQEVRQTTDAAGDPSGD